MGTLTNSRRFRQSYSRKARVLFGFFVGLVAFAGLAILAELQTYLQLRVAGGVVVVSAAFCAFHADHGLLWHRKMR